MHDPEVFKDPMAFQPERYLKDGKLNSDVRDPDSAVFGFGRRSVDPTYSPIYALMDLYPQYMSWKTSKRQLFIFNCVLSSRSIWYQTSRWRPGKYPRSETRVLQWITVVRMIININADQHETSLSIGFPFPLNVSSHQERQPPRRWSWRQNKGSLPMMHTSTFNCLNIQVVLHMKFCCQDEHRPSGPSPEIVYCAMFIYVVHPSIFLLRSLIRLRTCNNKI